MPSSFIYPCILLCCVCDDTCAVVGCRRQVPKRGSRGRVALGRRAVPLPPAPLHPADLRHRAVLECLLLLPAVRRRPPSRPQCRLLRCRQLLPPSGRACLHRRCLRQVRLWRPPRPRSLALRRSTRTFLFCNGSVTWRAVASRPPRSKSCTCGTSCGRCRGGGARNKGQPVPLVSSILGRAFHPLFFLHFTIFARSAGGGVGDRPPRGDGPAAPPR